jgi:hypothetical protein
VADVQIIFKVVNEKKDEDVNLEVSDQAVSLACHLRFDTSRDGVHVGGLHLSPLSYFFLPTTTMLRHFSSVERHRDTT